MVGMVRVLGFFECRFFLQVFGEFLFFLDFMVFGKLDGW